jgi:transposase
VAKTKREAIEMSALEAILEQARSKPLSDEQHRQLHAAITTLAMVTDELEKKRTSIRRLRHVLFGPGSEKCQTVLKGKLRDNQKSGKAHRGKGSKHSKGHGRNGADAYTGAERIALKHDALNAGDSCPETGCTGKLYRTKEAGTIVRIKGLPPVPATVYELEKLRCHLCGTVFTAQAPAGVGEDKFDETAASMIGLLRYGAGFPFKRLETLQGHLGIPLPASTQWETVEKAALKLEPAFEALVDQAAQGEVLHNDDTPMKILELMKENESEIQPPGRTGMFTSGILSRRGDHLISLFFTGRRHAGENLERVLKKRAEALDAPIQMCDGLSRNLPGALKTILANCLAHGRRRFVEMVDNFPEQCEYILTALGKVYRIDATARKQKLSPQARLELHQCHSTPVMDELKKWFDDQIDNKTVEPNSGLGEAISYMQNRWDKLTLFLREPGAPLDNNLAERALKKAILHRKGSLFYKTQNGARVGDIYMSLIHTAELAKINPFDYLCELQRHVTNVAADPDQWMPWNYAKTRAKLAKEKLEPRNRPASD